jgi:GAF domain-containing protein
MENLVQNVAQETIARNYYTLLHQAALAISSSLEPEEVLPAIVKSVTEAMGAKASVLRLLDDDTGQLRVNAAFGLSEEYLQKGPVMVQRSRLDEEVLACTPVYIADVRTDDRFQYRDAAAREGLVSALCVPLEVRDQAIGVLRVYHDEPAAFADEDVKFLTILASLAAQAIENARLFEELRNKYDGVIGAFWGTGPLLQL